MTDAKQSAAQPTVYQLRKLAAELGRHYGDGAEALCNQAADELDAAREQLKQAQAEVERLRRGHPIECPVARGWGAGTCTCGFAAALSASTPAPEVGGDE